MKPGYPFQPFPYQKAQVGRGDAILTGVGGTLLALSLLWAAILLLGIVPWLYGQFTPVLGSGMQQLPVLSFFAETHGMVFIVGAILAVILAALLSRTRHPGLALTIEGILVLGLCLIITFAIWNECVSWYTGAVGQLYGGTLRPMRPIN